MAQIRSIMKQMKKAADLKLHPILINLGMDEHSVDQSMQDFYAAEMKALGHYDTVCITSDGEVISNHLTWLAARANDFELEVEVVDMHKKDLIRLINAKSLFFKRNYEARYRLFKELGKYINTKQGAAWMDEVGIEGDINEKIGRATGYSRSLVKQFRKIGKYGDDNPDENVWANNLSVKDLINSIDYPDWHKQNQDKQEAKIRTAHEIKQEQMKKIESLRGKEPLDFTINWKEEGKKFKQSALPSTEDPNKMVYQNRNDEGELLVEIIVNVPAVFKATNDPKWDDDDDTTWSDGEETFS